MHAEIFTVCDAATLSGTRLNILGCMESVVADQFPARIPDCAVALRVRFENHEAGRHVLEIRLSDADGGLVLPPLRVNIEFPTTGTAKHAHIHVANFDNLLIPGEGEYSFDLLVDGQMLSRIPLFASRPPDRE